MAEVATEEFVKESREFINLMSKGPKLLSELPKQFQEPAFLDHMLNLDRIEFGRPGHGWTHANMKKESEKGPEIAQDTIKADAKLEVSGDWSWTNLSGQHCKTLGELLAEDETLDKRLHLRVRLVNKRR